MRRAGVLLVLIACGKPAIPAPDGGPFDDAGFDAGPFDAGFDDAGVDDAGVDDAGFDDAGTDAGRDAGAWCPVLAWRYVDPDGPQTYFHGVLDADGTAWLLHEQRDAGLTGAQILSFDRDGGMRLRRTVFEVPPLGPIPRDSDALAHPRGGPVVSWSMKDVYAFDDDGGFLWHHTTSDYSDAGLPSYAEFRALVGGHLLVIDANAFLLYVSVDPLTGDERWRRAQTRHTWPVANAAGEVLMASPTSLEVVALDGGTRWLEHPAAIPSAVALFEDLSMHIERPSSNMGFQTVLRQSDGGRALLTPDGGPLIMFEPAFDARGGFAVVGAALDDFQLMGFDGTGRVRWTTPLGPVEAWDVTLLEDGTAALFTTAPRVNVYTELRHYAASGALLDVCQLPDAGPTWQPFGAAFAPGRLMMMRHYGDIEAYDVGFSPAAHGWLSSTGDFTHTRQAR